MADNAQNHSVVKGFVFSSIFWLIVGLLVGLWIAAEMLFPALNLTPWLSFGRLRVVHTNGLIYGFTLSGIFACSYYMLEKLTRTSIAFPRLARAHLYLFNAAVLLAAVSLFAGISTAKEYSELEWPFDLVVVAIWVMFSVNVLGTLIQRREKQMYVSLWFLIATVVTVAVVYILNNLAIPVHLFKSYSAYAGVNDANVQWWFGHNAVASVFTFPILAMFYYFLPKSTGVPIYSHRLSIIAFWSLVFGYLCTGAHHLMLTPVPEWIQTVALAFSIFLIAPSWGSVINGYYTMNGNWEQVRTNYLTKFFLLGITFYGLQTLQGPTQALRSLTSLFHYTEWVVGHVHMGTMGWVTMIISASLYFIVVQVYGRDVHSVKLVGVHFWLILVGQLLFSVSLWIAGIAQGAMWKATNPDGSLTYTFLDTVASMYPYWKVRLAAGTIYFAGIAVFAYNLVRTARPKTAAA
ncbi:MAG TPA: cbb3-type cytochrome c oxidase subunit I [Candidatus Deferrimicrobiaceae bacterium]|nr:cbb3-type cytochrome c oxidase subunit I [Candidatus Deferrimicrobiaceae bacterium]